jgi:hypothetical protein
MGNTKQKGKRRRKAKREEPKEQPRTPGRKRVARGARPRTLSMLKRVRKWFDGFVGVAGPILKRVPKRVYGCFVGVAGLIVTVFALYPWLSIYPRESLDIRNPYSTPFDVTNDRSIPITSVTAKCIFDFGRGNHIEMGYDNFVAPLGRKQTVTAPCFHIVAGKALQSGNRATITMQIRYRLFGVFPRSQQFRFHSARADDGSSHWVYDG